MLYYVNYVFLLNKLPLLKFAVSLSKSWCNIFLKVPLKKIFLYVLLQIDIIFLHYVMMGGGGRRKDCHQICLSVLFSVKGGGGGLQIRKICVKYGNN